MSNAMVADFTQKARLLSYDDTLTVISILLDRLKQGAANDKKSDFFEDLYAIADNGKHFSEGKWTRDELYRY